MRLRLCSILGTLLLALTVASPALAKKKKASDDSSDSGGDKKKDKSAAADSGDSEGGGLDGLMDKSGNKDKAKPDSSEGTGGSGEEKKEMSVGDSWERPPAEQEKPLGPPPKPAAPPVGDGKRWSAGLLAGYAFKTDRSTAALGADPYGFGFGLRGGYHFDFKLYVGLFYLYYIGSSTTGSGSRVLLTTQTTHANYMQFGAEVGYDWWIGPVILRPSLEIGSALAITDVSGSSSALVRLMFGPGFTLIDPIGNKLFLGAEARANMVPSLNGVSGILLAATLGLRFD